MDLHTGRSLSFQYLKVMATSFLLCGSAGGGKHYVGWGKKQPLLWYKTYRHALLIQHSHSQAVGAKCRASFQRKPGAIRPAVPTVAWRRVGRLLARAVFFTNKTSSLQLNSGVLCVVPQEHFHLQRDGVTEGPLWMESLSFIGELHR